jgi:uncharacterized protein (DUF433 family)
MVALWREIECVTSVINLRFFYFVKQKKLDHRVKGTRISVEFILELLASHVTEDEIVLGYPHLSKEDIHACLIYAAHAVKNEIYIELEKAA